MEEKTLAAKRKEALFEQRDNVWSAVTDNTAERAFEFCEGYKAFLDSGKTEREACSSAIQLAETAGFVEYDREAVYQPGDRIYRCNRGKSVIFSVVGRQPISKGIRIAAAHIDSPRLDLKQHPLYEDSELAYFKTHYYGGIRKYQWPTIPLALHGVVIRRDGTSVNVSIGEAESDPCFVVTDLLPHLAAEQSKRKLADGIRGEELNILIGSRPFNRDAESEQVKLNIMNILHEKYGIVESDFVSAELEAVPAFKAKDVGFDRALIGAYGHDDRVCAYPSLQAILDCKLPEKTVLTILTDKEETGSDGNTGLNSAYLENFIKDLCRMQEADTWDVLSRSECLSADVNAAFDPSFSEPFEKRNASFINRGVVVTKYTGSRGKYDTSDASAEYAGRIRRLLDDNHVVWQTGELGKVDAGGGGTVAKYVAALNVDVIDIGVPVLSMHSPYEVVSKLDVYMTYQAVSAFFGDK